MHFHMVSAAAILAVAFTANAATISETTPLSASQSTSPAITGTPVSSSSVAKVARTATINGFADAIYDYIPSCAKSCVARDTSSTRCPYWELGCLCVWSPWGSAIGECVAEACKGSDVAQFTKAATSACASYTVPAPYWSINSVASSKLASAAANTGSASPSSTISTNHGALVSGSSTETSYFTNSLSFSSKSASESSSSSYSALSDAQYLNKTISSAAIVDNVSVYVTDSTTMTTLVCTKCKTLTGAATTYTTVSEGKTLTVTSECSTTTFHTSKNTYTSVAKSVSTSNSEGKSLTIKPITSSSTFVSSPSRAPASSSVPSSTRVASASSAPSVIIANAANTNNFAAGAVGLVMISMNVLLHL